MTKLRALILFLFSTCYVQAQPYNNQSPITINAGQSIVALLHYNGDASVKHPLLIMYQGAGEYGSDPNAALKNGTGWAIQNGKWNPDSTFNFKTGQYESFIVLSTLNIAQNTTPLFSTNDALFTYMRNNYPVDSNAMYITGLSAGGGTAADQPAHISNSNCCPPSYSFTTPKNILAASVSASAEILDSSSGVTQPVQFLVADSIAIWGLADSNDNQGHGLPIKHFALHANRLAPSLGSFYSNFNVGGVHGKWNDSVYNSSVRRAIPNTSFTMNIYEWMLYKRRGAPVAPPTQTITIGSIAPSSFCVTPTASASFSVTYTTTGTFNAGNTFNVQMSNAAGSFTTFTNVGSGASPITVTIPANTPTGANYKFRVQSTNPIVTSAASPIKAINLAANKIVPTANQTTNINVAGNTLTVRDSSTATSHQWFNNSVAIGGQTGTTYIPLFATVSIDTVTCKSVFSCGTSTSNKVIINVVNPSSSLVIPTKNTACGIHNFSSANPGDTILLDSALLDTLCELTFIHLNGTAAKPITIINKGLILSTAALTFVDDCHYVNANFGTNLNAPHAVGSVSLGQFGSKAYDVPYGLEVFGAVVPGGGVEIHGKDSNITVSNVYVHDRGAIGGAAGYGVIMKNDPATFGCDSTYDYPNTFSNMTFHDMVFKNINKDVMYLGYSGGYNTNGQGVVCGGVTRYFRPAIIAGLTMYNMYCNTAQRTFIQGGGLSGGNNVFHHMYADNLGGDSLNGIIDGSQGAFAAFGIPDSTVVLHDCGGNKTWLHNVYSYNYGLANFYNNTFDSAGYLTVHGVVQVNPAQSSIAFYPKANIYNVPTQIILQNNTLGKNSANFNVRLDFGNNPYATSGNIICNSGNVYNPVPVVYSTCAPLNTITTNTPAVTTYCVTQSVGANITVTGTSTGTFNAGNVYTAYMSDATGNFAISTLLGSVGSTSSSFSISGAVPANMPTGSGYRIRVLSSNPVITGTQNTANITINLAANSVTPSATQNLFINTNGNVLTVSETSTPTSGLWYVNNVSTGISIKTYTPNFATAGTYTVTYKSTFSCGVITSNSVTIVVTNPPTPKVTTGLISGSPFCVTSVTGANLSIPFTSVGTYPSGNQYIAQLSGTGGGFGSPVTIGTLTSTANAGNISATIPANTATSANYKIRIISTNPAVTGSSSASFTVNLAANSIAPIATQNIFTVANGNTLTVTEQSTATSRQWLSNGVAIAGQTASTYIPNFATAGTYNITCQSVFPCGTITSNTVIINVANPPTPTINTKVISGSPFCITASIGTSVNVPFTSVGTYVAGNGYTAQLSGKAGSFASAVNIGTLISTANAGTIVATIPANTPTGTGYRIRVISSNPVVTGVRNNANLIINLAANSIAPSATQNIFTGTSGNVLTVTEQSTAISRLWFVNGVSSGISDTVFTPNFTPAGVYTVTCHSVFACATITSNLVTINVTNAPPPPPDSVFTSVISGSPFSVTTSVGAAVSVPFTSNRGSFTSGNVFTAQLSNATGSFASPVTIGTLTSTAASGTISGTIPANTPTGTGYRIRVSSSNPVSTPVTNSADLTINLESNSIAPTATQNILTNQNGNILTVTETATAISRLWFVDGVSTGISTTTYTPNFASAGTYSVTCHSVFASSTITSNAVSIVVTVPPTPTINTGAISGSPFCVTGSAGAAVSVPFTSIGTYISGNIYTAQLSDANGSFASAINVGSLTSTANSGTISATIPAGIVTGTGYRIRVTSTNPVAVTNDNGIDLTVNLAGNSISPAATQNLFTSISGNVLTVAETSTATSRLWFVNNVSSGISTTTYTPNFATAGTYIIDCRSVFACGTITSNTVTVIVTIPPAPTVSTGIITGSPFCVTTSATASVSVPYTISGTFNAGNVFTAQLSDPTGSFNSFTNIGSVTSTASGTISATIPANTLTGTQYSIRVVSSNPVITGSSNAGNLVINLAANSIAPTNTQNIYTDSVGVPLVVTDQSAATHQWFYGTSSGVYPTNAGITASTYTPQFGSPNTYYVVCKSIFACGTITSNEVIINVTNLPPPPPDTTCTTTQIQHDTLGLRTFRRITPRDSFVTVTTYQYIVIFRIKIRLPFGTTTVADTIPVKDTTYFDSAVHFITPLHDTTICVITAANNSNNILDSYAENGKKTFILNLSNREIKKEYA